MGRLIRLGWSQFAVVAAGLGGVLAVLWIMFMPDIEDLYIRQVRLPQLADRYGFQAGMVRATRDGETYDAFGIVMVSPGGAFARMGVRAGDLPFAYHGYGLSVMYHALMTGERGASAEFEVLNAADWSAGRGRSAIRTIRVSPPGSGR